MKPSREVIYIRGGAKQEPIPAITFEELLRADEAEEARWREWFIKEPDALLDTPTDIAGSGTLRTLLLHVVSVQLLYAEWLTELSTHTDATKLPHNTAAEIYAISDRARSILWQWLPKATPDELAKFIEYRRGDFYLRATKRKAFLQIIFHNIHHYGQIATLVRTSGSPTDWIHDFIFSPIME